MRSWRDGGSEGQNRALVLHPPWNMDKEKEHLTRLIARIGRFLAMPLVTARHPS